MMQKIQKFGGVMFTSVVLFAFAGIVIGFGTLFTTEVIFGPLAAPGTMWYGVWNVILQGGWTVFNQLPLLFAVSLPIGLANKQNARCCNPEEQIGIDIIKKALTAPVATIAKNAGFEGAVIVDKVSELPAGEGLNSANGEWGNMIDMGVLDPVKVTRTTLQNAASVASLILITEATVSDVPKNTQLEDAIAAATAGAQGGGMY